MWCATHVRWVIRLDTRVGVLRVAVSEPDDFVFILWWLGLDGPGLVERLVVQWGRSCGYRERGCRGRVGLLSRRRWTIFEHDPAHGTISRVAGP